MPMVSITMENCGCPRIGRITASSSSTPKAAIATTARIAASQNGMPKSDMPANAPKAPSIIRSPCAKLTVSVAL